MTDWFGTDQDEDDALAPMATTPVEDDEEIDDFDQGAWTPELGFADGNGVLRGWVGEDNATLVKLRMSPNWRERLKKANATLESSFHTMFAQISNAARVDHVETDDTEPDRAAVTALSWESLNAMNQAAAGLAAQLESLDPDEGNGHWEGKAVRGSAPEGCVVIDLDEHGSFDEIHFDQEWLEEARVRQITEAVVKAHTEARRRHVPAVYVPGLRDELREGIQNSRNEVLAMMRRGLL